MSTFYTSSIPDRTLVIDQKEYLWCSGTSYLGMSKNPVFIQRVMEGMQQVGINWGSSRSNTLRLSIYEDAEAALAQWFGVADTLTVSSGMLAGQLALKWLVFQNPQVPIFYAPNVHPALRLEGFTPAVEDYENWFAELPRRLAATASEEIVVVTDSVGSPHTAAVPFDWLHRLPPSKKITVVIDDSHGLGVLGANGKGIHELINAPASLELLITASLNKAMSVPAGLIMGSQAILNSMRQFSMFSGASPANPAYLWALTQSLPDYQSAHQKLLLRVEQFVEALGEAIHLFHWIEKYPAFTTDRPGLHEYLRDQGILTACFPYPGPNDPAITRLVITPLHTFEDLRHIAQACQQFAQNS
ncbi:aminotransferase class I/II-fold pyridoxal phosphate-dependent enzyme [Siphonobacter sp. SORGH_AS_0500]|uniref:aminotransferase class I/II-fold pyridoxal phosphate-dependent enzyme n=1 Tax=Siphonobacter sp. SORGH_AS_0500 TaxID=1864824 RepID=UPI00286574D2|nr:aminotransferase class I/II-fold pyridoxal phosphate-dependent enzyme [Siphonobacter sp. SORGH_AS_0500]MDR6195556.1 8-amino-7-oxononanoate synthase [Siphonobacter sp. SORGH_AS_0500]